MCGVYVEGLTEVSLAIGDKIDPAGSWTVISIATSPAWRNFPASTESLAMDSCVSLWCALFHRKSRFLHEAVDRYLAVQS